MSVFIISIGLFFSIPLNFFSSNRPLRLFRPPLCCLLSPSVSLQPQASPLFVLTTDDQDSLPFSASVVRRTSIRLDHFPSNPVYQSARLFKPVVRTVSDTSVAAVFAVTVLVTVLLYVILNDGALSRQHANANGHWPAWYRIIQRYFIGMSIYRKKDMTPAQRVCVRSIIYYIIQYLP